MLGYEINYVFCIRKVIYLYYDGYDDLLKILSDNANIVSWECSGFKIKLLRLDIGIKSYFFYFQCKLGCDYIWFLFIGGWQTFTFYLLANKIVENYEWIASTPFLPYLLKVLLSRLFKPLYLWNIEKFKNFSYFCCRSNTSEKTCYHTH